MTFEQFAKGYLCQNGMFERDAQKVVDAAKIDDVFGGIMDDRWSDSVDEYPPFMKNIFVVSMNTVAVKWIDANQPQAWYRAVFA